MAAMLLALRSPAAQLDVANRIARRSARTAQTSMPVQWRRLSSTSALANTIGPLREALLQASIPDHVNAGGTPEFAGDYSDGGWSSVRGQAGMISSWPQHPLQESERLVLAEAIVERAVDCAGGNVLSVRKGRDLCAFYGHLLSADKGLIRPRSEGTAKCAVVAYTSEEDLPAASSEAVALMLAGYSVTIAAPRGRALDAAVELTSPFPSYLLQAEEIDSLASLPEAVRSVRVIGKRPQEVWAAAEGWSLPSDFGGVVAGGQAYGTVATSAPLALTRTDVVALARLPRCRFELKDVATDLLALLSTQPFSDAPTAPGLPPPRWAQSAFDRGNEEVHDLLDLLWTLREPMPFAEDGRALGLAPSHKHFLITSESTDVPEDIVKAAVVSAMSPFQEPVTLHVVGLGSRGLTRDPLRSFCRIVQSGTDGLSWRVQQHESWASFFNTMRTEWNHTNGEGGFGPPAVFGTLHGMEVELRKLCALAGGTAWGRLFVAEPMEQLRRWTRPHAASSPAELAQLCGTSDRPPPAFELMSPLVDRDE